MPSLSALLGGIDHLFQNAGSLSTSFLLEVDGLPIGRFSGVSGLQMSVEVETYAEGGENTFEHKFPGRVTWDNLVFKRGITHDNNLFNWFELSVGPGYIMTGRVPRMTAGITMLSGTGGRLRTWIVQDVFPVRWKGPEFDVGAEEVPTEELEVAHHGFTSITF
ncbi:MAG: phage tail protein [Actinomycetota bacterium]|jgi:phage tail-like protein|nr:phage tail protein [Actinomycetota bacterium]MDA3015266.1 phage tail protein [Actinomycetota bacterium]MDA3027685.1 phage tail protein [Actinomycetota bacterium]